MHVHSLLDVDALLDEDSVDRLVCEVRNQSEIVVRNYVLSIQRPSSLALIILERTFKQLQNRTGRR
jgi:hypothetical protein